MVLFAWSSSRKRRVPGLSQYARSFQLPPLTTRDLLLIRVVTVSYTHLDVYKRQVVISAKEAERYFGSQDWANILGRTIIYDDTVQTTVTGIVQDFDQISDFQFKDFISYATARAAGLTQSLALDNWHGFNSSSETFVKLDKGVSPARIEAELKKTPHLSQIFGSALYFRVRLQPLANRCV